MTPDRTKTDEARKTLELLWTRVRQRGDLPGFSKVVTAIIGAMRGDDDREFNMTKTVLADPALTQRVLRLANSAMYAAFGQGISTVSKAVIVLGTESIGHLALGLKLIDGLSSASVNSDTTRSEMEKAVLAGHIARQVASSATTRDTEEAVVCSMLHSLGRMMVVFYLPDLWALVQSRAAHTGADEKDAATDVLGLGLDAIGRAIARQWGLPGELIASLHDVTPPEDEESQGEPLDHSDWLAAVSTMSTRCASILCEAGVAPDNMPAALTVIAEGYAQMLGLDAAELLAAVETARMTIREEVVLDQAQEPTAAVATPVPAPTIGKPADSVAILKRGIADMRDAAISASTGQLMTMGLETVYQGLGLFRAVAFLRNQEQGKYVARMCFGEGAQELMPKLVFDDAYQPDVFHAALANDKMIFIEDAQIPAFATKLPRWWRDALPTTRSFMVLPLTVGRHPVGFIYGDWGGSLPHSKIESAEIMLVDELRALVVKAVATRRQAEPTWGRTMN